MRNFSLLARLAIVPWLALSAGSAVAQDEGAGPGASDTGTPGLVDVANNLNLPAVPQPPQASGEEPAGDNPPILPDTPVVPATETLPINLFANIGSQVSNATVEATQSSAVAWLDGPRDYIGERYRQFLTGTPASDAITIAKAGLTYATGSSRPSIIRAAKIVYSYTNPSTGITVNLFGNATFASEDSKGTKLMTGYFGYGTGDILIAFGEATNGTRFAFYDDYFSAYTANGDVVTGNQFTAYTYDFDEDGKLLGLTDSDGGKYDVNVEDSGLVSITGPDGYSFEAGETGAYELYDEAGVLVVAGDLFDASYDEFAEFEGDTEKDIIDDGDLESDDNDGGAISEEDNGPD